MIGGILGAHPFTRRRFAVGSRGTDGRYTPGASTDTTLFGSIQPDGKTQTTDRWGERSSSAWRCLTTGSLRPVDQAAQTLADRVIWNGVTYEVRQDKTWTAILPHQTYNLVQIQESDPGPQPQPTEGVIQGVRAWLKAAVGLTDAQVIPGDDKGPRPPLPYLVVTPLEDDAPAGEDTRQAVEGDTATVDGGTTGDTYALEILGVEASYTRQAGDTDADVAAGVAAAAAEIEGVAATADGATVLLISIAGADLDTTLVSGDMAVTQGAIPAEVAAGMRTATVEIAGYGRATVGWMATAIGALRLQTGIAPAAAAGIAVRVSGGAANQSVLLDTAIEHRWTRTVLIDYYLRAAGSPLTPLTTVSLSGVLSSPVAGDLPLTVNLDLE